MANRTKFTAPGLSSNEGAAAATLLQERLGVLTDLQLTLKHVHWNVVGPNFIAVHKMLDPQVKAVRKMVDETAERIATLGLSPNGTLGALAQERDPHDDYPLGRADTLSHLEALDHVYDRVISQHRQVMGKLEDIDLVSQDMIIQQLGELEQFQWFVRAHREDPSGKLTSPEGSSAGQAGSRQQSSRAAPMADMDDASFDEDGLLEESGGPNRSKRRK
jgi:starvation-inducible DNA-binding protein